MLSMNTCSSRDTCCAHVQQYLAPALGITLTKRSISPNVLYWWGMLRPINYIYTCTFCMTGWNRANASLNSIRSLFRCRQSNTLKQEAELRASCATFPLSGKEFIYRVCNQWKMLYWNLRLADVYKVLFGSMDLMEEPLVRSPCIQVWKPGSSTKTAIQ